MPASRERVPREDRRVYVPIGAVTDVVVQDLIIGIYLSLLVALVHISVVCRHSRCWSLPIIAALLLPKGLREGEEMLKIIGDEFRIINYLG